VDQVLRGKGQATWGAVGATFINDHGQRFTAFRVYYVPARAARVGEITMRMATYDGAIDMADLADHIEGAFPPKALKAAFSGLRTHDTYASFASTLHTRLGIGANGDGAKAMRLLVRMQSGHQIRTVDELYKEMVLERPATYAAADRALDHFDDLEAAYVAMQTEQQKADLLAPITERHTDLAAAQDEIATLDTFGLTRAGDTPLTLWSLRTEARLLDTAADANNKARIETGHRLRDAEQEVTRLERELAAARDEHREAGGATLERLALDISQQQQVREHRANRRAQLADRIVVLGKPLASHTDFDTLRTEAEGFQDSYHAATTETKTRRDAVLLEQYPLLDRKKNLTEERASLSGRESRIRRSLDGMRYDVARAASMDPADLPFLAELIDVAPDQARWRTAIETVLGASARLLLVPREHLDEFSIAIDSLQLRGRLTFIGAPRADLAPHPPGDTARVAGKLLFKDSPYRSWVHRHVTEGARNARCVENADELAGPGYRVTRTGQTRQGVRGAHGRTESANIIGFSSREAMEEITAELGTLEHDLAVLDRRRNEVEEELATLDRLRRAYDAVADCTWDEIDVEAIDVRIEQMEAQHRTILESDDKLRALEKHIEHLDTQVEKARDRRFGLTARIRALEEEHSSLVDRQDATHDELERIATEQRVQLSDAQAERLDTEFAEVAKPDDPDDLDAFARNLVRLKQRLDNAIADARKDADRATSELERIFAAYQLKWEDPNLGQSISSYPDYARIVENIVSTGLHERRAEWRRRLTDWSGQDLVPLSGAMKSAIEDIEDRLEPINEILRTLPFGATRDRLRIKLRRLAPDNVTQFRKQLHLLSSTATKEFGEDQLERRFRDLQLFMAHIRRRDDPHANREVADRDRLLDVRRHVEITAERYSHHGELLSTHASLGSKSGGESQELVAFIVGAALRFRLGDELRSRPRFAPVFLDEGFVKSDAEFAGRAVQAWKGLGFQLIVGVPLDKVTALEPHMDELLAITKNTTTNFSYVTPIKDAVAHDGDPGEE
jgi:uncharacterized protein YPO0396